VAVATQTATATVASLPAATFSASANRAAPTAPTAIAIVSGNAQATDQHTQLTTAFVAQVTDALGNGVPGISVTFAADASSGYVSPKTLVTDASGNVSWNGYVHAAGAQTVVASANALTADVLVHVNATPYTYDGVYSCATGFPANDFFALQVLGTIDLQPPHGLAQVARTDIAADGSFSNEFFLQTLSDAYTVSGTITIDASQKATIAGTYVESFNGGPSSSPAPYTCSRQ